jgi:hypothetical protein
MQIDEKRYLKIIHEYGVEKKNLKRKKKHQFDGVQLMTYGT